VNTSNNELFDRNRFGSLVKRFYPCQYRRNHRYEMGDINALRIPIETKHPRHVAIVCPLVRSALIITTGDCI